ncbi:hypothetical protein [Actinoplanes regularis]|uniref:hypothetical protein n=1 Tax=Actinoplanes regularis TaxID=52697 RepID=UPI0024A2B25A|nr:hypothetical protein [Actinoplanes regularis]GLW33566.1 hypothetical protein Areg01_65040 [Actinoplanes regularis]
MSTNTIEHSAQDVSPQIEQIKRRIQVHGDDESLQKAARLIADNLEGHGITFEGRDLPVSLMPTVVLAEDAANLARSGACVRDVLNRALDLFVEEHRQGKLDGPMHRFFTPYYKFWDLIAAEQRRLDHIQLMRYDAVSGTQGRWSFMETNTGCPGGVIHCARIRDAWMSTPFGEAVCAGEDLAEFAVDRPEGFVKFLAAKAAEIDSDSPNIAILNSHGVHTNELESLRRCHAELREQGVLPAGELLLGDIRDISVEGDRGYLRGKPVALIYNKLPARLIDPDNPELRGWIDASMCGRTEFLNSWGATFLTEAKRALALVSDPEWNAFLELTDEEIAIIQESVPYTRLVEDAVAASEGHASLLTGAKNSLVLKADLLTRGSGVYIGDGTSRNDWAKAVADTRAKHGVLQVKCDLPTRTALGVIDPSGAAASEYFGVDAFFFGSQFAGLVSRSHTNQVFNVGNGGKESPVLIVKPAEF